MSSFPCLVRSLSSCGQARYALGDRLVDRYLEFVAGRARPNTSCGGPNFPAIGYFRDETAILGPVRISVLVSGEPPTGSSRAAARESEVVTVAG